jgi:AcrR family transcriptional regulator
MSQEARARTRARIADAALALYREGGLEAVTMRAVAAKLGAGASWLYGHYANRTALLDSIWQEAIQSRFQTVIDEISSLDDPVERLRCALFGYARFALEEPEVFQEAFLQTLKIDRSEAQRSAPYLALLERLLDEAGQCGALRGELDTRHTAQMLWSAVHGSVSLPVNLSGMDLEPSKAIVFDVVDTMLRGLCMPRVHDRPS